MGFCAFFIVYHPTYAQSRVDFNIDAMPADQALTLFAKQANTTLLFPYELAAKEQANPLKGEYTIEIGIVLLLEGTKLYPVTDSTGQLSVRAIDVKPSQFAMQTPASNHALQAISDEPRNLTYNEALLETYVEKIAIVGSRATPRNAIDSSVPLDVINIANLSRQGNSDLISMLSKLIPSLNVNDQPINDASTLVRPANLRGMSSDHTLVLVNGKRRHRSAVISFLGGGLSDGAQGPDIAAIPYSGLKQVGVLRDGASAQYGSDAIAGVLNFALKDDDEGGVLETRFAQYYEGDGESFQLAGGMGFSLPSNGFLYLTGEYREQSPTSRSIQREDAAILEAAGVPDVPSPSQLWGTPTVHYDGKFSYNLGVDLSAAHEFYSFANYSKRSVEGGFFYRNPETRSGVNVIDIRQSDTNNDGVIDMQDEVSHFQWLVADLTPDLTGNCPQVTYGVNEVLFNRPEYQQVLNNPNCFAFNELFPGGFTPKFSGDIEDVFWVAGVSGELNNDWQYDVSGIIGYSKISYGLENTINPSLGPYSPTNFKPGGAVQIEQSLTFDVKKEIELSVGNTLNFAGGFEVRNENYRQIQGDEASYKIGFLAFDPDNMVSQGFSVGSNGFPGYRPETAGSWSRSNWATYVDVEANISNQMSLGMAARYEDFSDFGSTFDGKLSVLLDVSDSVALRASINTGFKAPTVGQSNVINVTTAFGDNGLEDQATLPPTSPISQQLGATPLRPEESVNTSFGLVNKFTDNLYLTVDFFHIKLEDRISTTSAIPLRATDIEALNAQGVLDADRFGAAKYFTNDFDTTTKGLDLVLSYLTDWWAGQTQISLNYNWTATEIDRITQYARIDNNGNRFLETNLTPQRIRMIEENIPRHRGNISLSQTFDRTNALLRVNYFGEYYEDHLDASAGLDIEAGSEMTVDIEFGYRFNEQLQIMLGANNVLDNSPDNNPHALRAGALYPSTSPMGINGGLYYLRSIYSF